MDTIERYALSVILSFLSEADGCSLLITQRRWAFQLLPVFRLRPDDIVLRGAGNDARNRHKFIAIPVQDATVRLDQRNTRTLCARCGCADTGSNAIGGSRQSRRPPTNLTVTQLAQSEALIDSGSMRNTETLTANIRADAARLPPLPALLRFLSRNDDHMFQDGITLLASYPRSGNSLVRSYLEQITGIVTGSDTRPDRTLSLALANLHGLVGEGICHRKRWNSAATSTTTVVYPSIGICKTHWPERNGCQKYHANRVVLLVRNPYDAIDSYWNLCVTNTHTEKVTEDVYLRHWDFYWALFQNEMKVWTQFHEFYLRKQHAAPLLVVRYEDLISQPQQQLERIMQFCGNADDAALWQRRIAQVLQHGTYGYQSATNVSPKFGKSLRRFTVDQVQQLKDRAVQSEFDNEGVSILQQLGYDALPQRLEQPRLPASATGTCRLLINDQKTYLRPLSCPYGRRTRDWRRMHTDDDTNPFPTVRRETKS